ncbi:unnamed protein product [Amoebophrya sp. A25]|nr:unnamed protein product [Amoebophrya sp. A25]|eukprot:GSA25T00020169001.1
MTIISMLTLTSVSCSAGPTRAAVRRAKKVERRTALFVFLCGPVAASTADFPSSAGCGIQPEPEHCSQQSTPRSGLDALLDLVPAYDLDGTLVEYGLLTFREARSALQSFIETRVAVGNRYSMRGSGGGKATNSSATEKTGNGLKWAIVAFLLAIFVLLLFMSCYSLIDKVQNRQGTGAGDGRVPVIGTDLKLERAEYLRLLRLAEDHERLREECQKLQKATAALTQRPSNRQSRGSLVVDDVEEIVQRLEKFYN